jgi:endonuclease YncB( thermonuclease family)
MKIRIGYYRTKNMMLLGIVATGLVLALNASVVTNWPFAKGPEQQLVSAASSSPLIGRSSVVDGDTIEIHDQRIRIWGVDAPESRQFCSIGTKPWRCGRDAAIALSDWLGARVVACKGRDRDQYGRTVAMCTVDGDDVAVWLVRNGWALDWPRYSNGKYATFQREAAAAKVGVWQGDFEKPWDWRHAQ